MSNFNGFYFENKEQYLAEVAQWKSAYKELSKNIRALKVEYKKAQREGISVYPVLGQLNTARELANTLLELRAGSKVEAQRQYVEQKNSGVVQLNAMVESENAIRV